MLTFRTLLRWIVVTTFLSMLLNGCTSTELYTFERLPPIAQYEPTTDDLRKYRADLEHLAVEYGLRSVPEVDIVRWVDPEDVSPVMVDCLKAMGIDVKLTGPYSYQVDGLSEQAESINTASYECRARYPVRADIDRPANSHEQRALYHHLVTEWLPCVEELGYKGLSTPSFETYAAFLSREQPDPVFVEFFERFSLNDGEFSELMSACPQRPPGFRQYDRR